MVVRWLALEPIAPGLWDSLARLLDDAERARAARFHFARDRDAYVAAHALARTMLSGEVRRPPSDWRFAVNDHGKPEAICDPGAPALRFNLSHTRGLVAVALTMAHDIGVDVEIVEPRRLGLDLAARMFASAEVAMLRATAEADLPEAMFAIWTLKEACIKAMGRGLSVPLDAFALELDPLAVRFPALPGEDPAHWLLRRFRPTPAHTLALALRHPDPGAVCIDAGAITASQMLALVG